METNAVEIKSLKFNYRPEVPILDIPNLNVSKGEKVFLYGPSGSGKSTFLELLAGVLIPQEGSIELEKTIVNQLSASLRDQFRAQNIGYIFQNFNLLPFLSVSENISLGILFNNEKIRFSEKKKNELIEKLGLADFKNHKVNELSVGQQQRVALARALWMNPKLILADEPTSALDWEHREKFIQLLFELSSTTIIFVSHDRTLEKLFDRSISLKEINQVKR